MRSSIIKSIGVATIATIIFSTVCSQFGLFSYILGYSLNIDDSVVGYLRSDSDWDIVLDSLKERYRTDNTISIEFEEDILVDKCIFHTNKLNSIDEMLTFLSTPIDGFDLYTVVKGDTWSQIANSHGMSSAELEQLNPYYDISKIKVGDVLNISSPNYPINVVTKEKQTYTELIQNEIIYRDEPKWEIGREEFSLCGHVGSAEVTNLVRLRNGIVCGRVQTDYTVLIEPETSVIRRGTKTDKVNNKVDKEQVVLQDDNPSSVTENDYDSINFGNISINGGEVYHAIKNSIVGEIIDGTNTNIHLTINGQEAWNSATNDVSESSEVTIVVDDNDSSEKIITGNGNIVNIQN